MIEIVEKSPHTLNHVAWAACDGHPNALNAIAEQLKQIPSENLIEIFKKSPHTLSNIAVAAQKGHPNALNAIAEQLKQITSENLSQIFKDSPHTLGNIAGAAQKRHPNALNAIAEQLKQITSENLIKIVKKSPHTLANIAGAACNGHTKALNALENQLKQITSENLSQIFKDSPHTLRHIALAAVKGSPHLFQTFLQLFIKDHGLFKPIVNKIDSKHPETCLPVERIIFNYLKFYESFDLSSRESIIRLNDASSMALPYLLEHGLVPQDRVDEYQGKVNDMAYLKMKKAELLVGEITGSTFMTQKAFLNSIDPTEKMY